MTAISQGVPVVSEEWITVCEQAGHIVGADFYAVQSATVESSIKKQAMSTPSPVKKKGPLSISKPSPGGGSDGNALSGITMCASG